MLDSPVVVVVVAMQTVPTDYNSSVWEEVVLWKRNSLMMMEFLMPVVVVCVSWRWDLVEGSFEW